MKGEESGDSNRIETETETETKRVCLTIENYVNYTQLTIELRSENGLSSLFLFNFSAFYLFTAKDAL